MHRRRVKEKERAIGVSKRRKRGGEEERGEEERGGGRRIVKRRFISLEACGFYYALDDFTV